MIPIRVGDEATLKASGLRFRIVTVDEFTQIAFACNRTIGVELGWGERIDTPILVDFA